MVLWELTTVIICVHTNNNPNISREFELYASQMLTLTLDHT